MDKRAVLDIIARFKQALESGGISVDRMVLYGSWAEGKQHEGSDIDIVVISEDFRDKDFWQRINILTDAIFSVFEPIEAVALTPEEWEKGDSSIVGYAKHGQVVFG